MIKIVIFVIIIIGRASQYGLGRMESNIALRQAGLTAHDLPMDLSGYDGFVAVRDCSDIGQIWYIRPANCEDCEFEKFLVADCAGVADGGYHWMITNNIWVEIDWLTAVRWGVQHRIVWIEIAKRVRISPRPYFE